MKRILKIVFLSLIPTVLVYIGKSEEVATWVQQKLHIFPEYKTTSLMAISFFIGIFFSGLIIPISLGYLKDKYQAMQDNFLKTVVYKKVMFVEAIKAEIKQYNVRFNVRIFRKRKGFIAMFNRIFSKKTEFEIYNVLGLAEPDNTEGLKFQVYPKIEGLVGYVYQQRTMIYDDDIEQSDSKNVYNLNDYQKSKVQGVKFCLGAPIFDKKNRIEIIITIDSEDKIKIDESKIDNWDLIARRYSQAMHHCAPIILKC